MLRKTEKGYRFLFNHVVANFPSRQPWLFRCLRFCGVFWGLGNIGGALKEIVSDDSTEVNPNSSLSAATPETSRVASLAGPYNWSFSHHLFGLKTHWTYRFQRNWWTSKLALLSMFFMNVTHTQEDTFITMLHNLSSHLLCAHSVVGVCR